MRRKRLMMAWLGLLVSLFATSVSADTVFLEAETMQASSSGWVATSNDQTGRASRTKTLWGADGAGDAVAAKTVRVSESGRYRVWARYMQVGAWRGPFQVAVTAGDKQLAAKTFDLEIQPGVADWEYTWQSFDADLPAGEVTLSLTKHEQKNCVGYVRHVDCVLLTTDDKLVPDHLPFGPQTLVRVTMGEGYDRPVYLHLFADHYRSPWYAHYALGRDGIRAELAPPAEQMLKSGDVTPWCNLTPTVYQDSGAALNLSVRHSYHEKAARFRAKLEFGRTRSDRLAETGGRGSRRAAAAADIKPEKRLGGSLALPNEDVEIIKTFDVEATPNGLVIIAPPDLESPQNIARLKRDREFADEIGKLADAFEWPKHGRKPVKIPFLVSANIGGYELPVDAAVTAREQKTLDYFGFNGAHERILHGAWHMQNDSYCRPDLAVMRERVKHDAELFKKSGRRIEGIAACMLMDEPSGQAAAFMAKDVAYRERFREWLKAKSLKPDDLLVSSWDAVRPVAESERDQFPALHYFTQLFRTRAIGDFMATQRRIIEEAYGLSGKALAAGSSSIEDARSNNKGPAASALPLTKSSLPFLVNFSDGAVYHANFCGQGIDYFELLDADDQNAIWGEDWANNSSTFQCGAFNVALMQSAARKRGQTIGHYLIAHAGRTPWDIKTKAVSETARGVRLWMNFAYGPNWSSHEGGPTWRSHLWHHRPELWTANAEISREIGAVEDWLVTAKPAPAEVAILYSSSSDIWTMPGNVAFGHDRMHTWLALSHAQTPVDIVPERDVERETERLGQYKVIYLSGPNLTRAAAATLRTWVESGGTLWLTAGAASRDEFNRPLDTLQSLLPVERGELTTPEPYNNSGKFLSYLNPLDTVTWGDQQLEVLSVKQSLKVVEHVSNVLESKTALTPKGNGHVENVPHVLATFKDGQPAVVTGRAGKGQVLVCGFLPALSYIKPALMARRPLEQTLDAHHATAKLKASDNNDQPEATNATASTASKAAAIAGISPGDRELLDRSHNPWVYPAGIRDRLLTPIRTTKLTPSLTCDTPLIDAVELRCEQGVLLALSNHTLKPLDRIELRLKTDKPVTRAESVRLGPIPFERLDDGSTRIALALAATDFVTISTQADVANKELKLGKTTFVVVTATEPTVEEQTAATWLSETLEQVTGAKFPIRAAGKDDASDAKPNEIRVRFDASMKPEEWRIQTVGESLLLTGGKPRGAIYAVCEFLERHVGVARLDPFTEYVPKQPSMTIPALNRSGRPAFPNRFVFTGWPYQNSLPQGVNGARWRVWNKEHIYAGPANGDFPRAVPDGVHTFGHFISAKEFAAEHPEYFSMDANGKRMTDDMGNKQLWIQLCVTNPDVRRITLERAKQMLRDDEVEAKKTGRAPARMVVLSQNDNTSNLCLCPNCKAISDREGSESGALLDYVNHVARGLKAEFPDVTVQTEAYNFTLAPPKTIRPEPNVMIRYCDNYGLSDMTRPLTDPRNAERLSLLDVWAKSAQQLGIWDYWRTFDPHPPGLFAPSSNVSALHRDIQLFRKRNVKYVTIEVEDFLGAGLVDNPQSNDLQSFMPLRCWLGMKLLDDPDRDVNALLDTFCNGYYRAAAKPMLELLEIIEERQEKIAANSSNMRRHVWLEALCDANFFADAYRCLDAAALAAKDDAASLVHVRRERIIVDAAFLWIEASVRRQAGASTTFPSRADVLKRHRDDWTAYVASVFDEAGQKNIAPLIEPGLQLLEKLQTADTDSTRTAIATTESAITHDGKLDEPFWQQTRSLRLLPRDPLAANDDQSQFRFAWTPEALFVGIEQPLDKVAASYDVSLMTPDRKGVQVELFAQPSGSVSAYFYAYPPTGMIAVPNRKSLSKFVASKTTTHATAEFRIPWTDLPTEAKPNDELLLNIATYPKLDSKTPSHVSSPWLIGTSPTYNPAYYGSIRLGSKDAGVQRKKLE